MTEYLIPKLKKVHCKKSSRIAFNWAYTGVIFFLLILFMGASVMLYFGVKFVENKDFDPSYGGNTGINITNLPLFIGGIVLFIVSFSLSVYLAFVIPAAFKQAKINYLKTDDYRKKVRKYEDVGLT